MGRRFELRPEIGAKFFGELRGFRQQRAESSFHRLPGLHAQVFALLFPLLVFGDDVVHEDTQHDSEGSGAMGRPALAEGWVVS